MLTDGSVENFTIQGIMNKEFCLNSWSCCRRSYSLSDSEKGILIKHSTAISMLLWLSIKPII